MSGEIDLGLRLFLIDQASPELGMFVGVLGMFGQSLYNVMAIPFKESLAASGAEAKSLEASIQKMSEAVAVSRDAQAAATVEMNALNTSYAAGTISTAEYNDGMATQLGLLNTAQADEALLTTQIDASTVSLDAATASTDAANASLATLSLMVGGIVGAAAVFLGFAAGIKAVEDQAANLDDVMAQIEVGVLGASGNVQGMTGYLTTLASNSKYSTAELGQGFVTLGERGYTASQIIGQNMGGALNNLSEAIGGQGGSGVTGAAGILASTMELWRAKAQDSAKYADLLTWAFYNGIPSADGLRSAIEAVGGSAEFLNIPASETIVALDGLARSGMSASQAGSSLNYYLAALSTPLPKAQAELANLGLLVVNQTTPAFENFTAKLDAAGQKAGQTVPQFDGSVKSLDQMFLSAQNLGVVSKDETFYQWATHNAGGVGILTNKFYDANGNFIGMKASLKLLNDTLSGTPEDKVNALSQLFNIKSGQGAKDLLANLPNVLKMFDNQPKQSPGLALKDKNIINDTPNVRATQLATTLSSFGAQVGAPFADAMKNIALWLNNFVSGVLKAHPEIIGFMQSFLKWGAILGGIGLVIGLVVGAIAFFATPMGAVVGIVLLVAAGITLLAGAFAWLGPWFQTITAKGSPLMQFFQTMGNYLGKIFGPLFAELGQNIQQAGVYLSGTWASVSKAFNQLGAAMKPVLPVLGYIAIGIGVLVGVAIALLAGVFMGILRGLGAGLTALATGFILIFAGIIHIITGFVLFFTGLVNIFRGIWIGITTGNWAVLQQGWNQLVQGTVQIFKGLALTIAGIFVGVFGTIIGFVWGFVQGVIGFFQHLWSVLVGHSIIPDMLTAILQWFINIFNKVTSTVGSWISNTISLFASLPGKIMGALASLGSMLLNAGSNMMSMLASGITNGIGFVTNAVSNAAAGIKHMLGFASPPKGGPLADSDTYMPNMMRMYAGHITQHTPLLSSAIHGAATALSHGFTSPSTQAMQNARSYAPAGVGGSSQMPTTLNFNVDGKPVATCVMDWVTGKAQMNGMSRVLR